MIKLLKPLAILSIVGFPAAVAAYRFDLIDFATSFNIIKGAFLLAVAVFFIGMVLSFIKRADGAKAKASLGAATLALVTVVGLGTQIFTARSVPYIHNVSTDVANPPVFDKVVDLRSSDHNSLEYSIEDLAAVQTKAYPKVKTLMSNLSLVDAHAKAKGVVEALGWELVNSDASTGIIEATETTLLWGFKDDVVIRLTEIDGKTAVDLRSVSRIGGSDLGANAKRIEKFLTAFSN